MIRTYLERGTFQIKTDYAGGGVWGMLAAYVGVREYITNIDPTRFGIFALLCRQANLTVESGNQVTLPYGIVVPVAGDSTHYVTVVGRVGGTWKAVKVSSVDAKQGRITLGETVDSGTNVHVHCVPRIPVLVELRLEPPESGLRLQRTVWVADVSGLVERNWYKAPILFPTAFPIPEDWILSLWVRCELPIVWADQGVSIPHRIAIPITLTHAPGLQDAVKAGLYSDTTA